MPTIPSPNYGRYNPSAPLCGHFHISHMEFGKGGKLNTDTLRIERCTLPLQHDGECKLRERLSQ